MKYNVAFQNELKETKRSIMNKLAKYFEENSRSDENEIYNKVQNLYNNGCIEELDCINDYEGQELYEVIRDDIA